ncbi:MULTISPECIES: hypothetical protein [unclassified Hoeflea]|jgi:hypothetical protein|uniref:hypothetical protein n=1 Tax=unclassified Hoeflea TaxID=2614931 RepID=UPI00399008E6
MSYYDHATMMALKLGPWRETATHTRDGHIPHCFEAVALHTAPPVPSNGPTRLVRQLLGRLATASTAIRAASSARLSAPHADGGDAPGKT